MKKITLFAILWVSVLNVVLSQAPKETEFSNAEKFSKKPGTLIEKQSTEIGKVKDISIEVVKFKDLIGNTSMSALRLEYRWVGTNTSERHVAFLDKDEIDGLITSVKYLQNNVITSKREIETEVYYLSKTSFKIKCEYQIKLGEWFSYLYLKPNDGSSGIRISSEDFFIFLGLVETAKAKM